MRMRRSVIMCGQSGCTMFLHIISWMARLYVIESKMCVSMFCTNFSE
jgi:hypothetical protein